MNTYLKLTTIAVLLLAPFAAIAEEGEWYIAPSVAYTDDDGDRKIADPNMSQEHRERVATAKNVNNSDVDFCEVEGGTYIVYSWGNQHGIEHLAEAWYDGTEAELLQGFFPEQ